MIVKQYIKEFEKLGFGMFVHFGVYSLLGAGEWARFNNTIPSDEYDNLYTSWNPDVDWAEKLAYAAKEAGCKYITITTRHHDGFSLFDTCGLNSYDSVHSLCKRDVIKEFVESCRKYNLKPFFYHTLLDWHEENYQKKFSEYLVYLRKSIEILCKNYGEIGGFWFDGMWDNTEDDWEEDALYSLIRQYQPNAMIINNTGLSEQGKLGHIELDSVTFERGKPQPINLENSPKYVASEMCQVFCDHWGYAKEDLNYKSPARIIQDLVSCRKYGANFLLNVGLKGDGKLRTIDSAFLEVIGEWVSIYKEAIYLPRPTNIVVKGNDSNFLLKGENAYYLFCFGLPMVSDKNVALFEKRSTDVSFELDEKISNIFWLDNNETIEFVQNDNDVFVKVKPFTYGRNLVVRVAKIEV